MIKIVFVCLGNICRSPLAEGIFKNMVKKEGLSSQISIDSAGTANYHIGKSPDHRSCSVARKYEIVLEHKARQFLSNDFHQFDYILAMDRNNFEFIRRMKSQEGPKGKLLLMRAFDPMKPSDLDVLDPYHGGPDEFEEVYEMLLRCCKEFLSYIIKENNLKNASTVRL